MSDKQEAVTQMVADAQALIADGALTFEDIVRDRMSAGCLLERAYETMAGQTAEIERLRTALGQIVTIANSSKEGASYIKHMVDMFMIAENALKSPADQS